MGSPCRTPLVGENIYEKCPLTLTESLTVSTHLIIKETQLSLKPSLSIMHLRYLQLRDSAKGIHPVCLLTITETFSQSISKFLFEVSTELNHNEDICKCPEVGLVWSSTVRPPAAAVCHQKEFTNSFHFEAH